MAQFDDLVGGVAARVNMKRADAEKLVRAVFEEVAEQMGTGERVVVPKFGIFEPFFSAEHQGRNPQTGEEITIPARYRPKFRPSSVLEKRIN